MWYLWCGKCECVYPWEEWIRGGRLESGVCPTPLCAAQASRYGIPWDAIAKAGGYVDNPVIGERYPLFSRDMFS